MSNSTLTSLEAQFEEETNLSDDSNVADNSDDTDEESSQKQQEKQQKIDAAASEAIALSMRRTRTLREDRHEIKHFLDKSGKVIPYVNFDLLEQTVESNPHIFNKLIDRLVELESGHGDREQKTNDADSEISTSL